MIDIIIPVYNAHSTIINTLMTIAMQTIKDKTTVYLIDDNSIFDYSQIIKLFEKELNIRQLNLKKNHGPGYARQYGINHSKGDYILFLDADDYLYNCFSLEFLYKALNSGYDMAYGIILEERNEGKYEFVNFQNSLHGKMYRRKFIEQNNIVFPEFRYHEDNAFNRLFLLANPKTYEINEILYIYKNNINSVTKSEKDYEFKHLIDFINSRMWVFEYAELQNFSKRLIAELIFDSYMTMFVHYNMFAERKDVDLIFAMCKPLYQKYAEYFPLLKNEKMEEVYYKFTFAFIPLISLNDFSKRIEGKLYEQ